MNREAIIVPETKEKINRIKRKYKNAQMSDEVATKIQGLEVTNKILKAATIGVGFVAALDWIIPDPVLGIDEAFLTGATTLLRYTSKIVSNKIEELATTGNAELQIEEVNLLSRRLEKVAKQVSEAKMARRTNSR